MFWKYYETLDHVHTLGIDAVPKRILLWIYFVSILLWCYPQHKSRQSHSAPKVVRSDFGILSAKCEHHETEKGSGETKSFPVKVLFLFSPIKINFSYHFGFPWHCCYLLSLQLTPCYLFLDGFNCSTLITCVQLIPEHSAGCVDRSLRSKNASEQNLTAKCEHSLNISKAHFHGNMAVKNIKTPGDWSADFLNLIFWDYFNRGSFPPLWEKANLIPIHKKVENYQNLQTSFLVACVQ